MTIARSFCDVKSLVISVTSAYSPGELDSHGKGRSLTGDALDDEPPTMARKDVLDDGEAEAGSTLVARFCDIDAIEALGQPRQMLGRDSGAIVAHRGEDL